ncbi:MAG: AMP-binding protein [Actinobacteria bacterium]|nr:AMP-binding protein [Actinomycetota bacterium]
MTNWNLADIWETVALNLGSSTALVHGDRRISWAEMNVHADGIARNLLMGGLELQDKVALYLYNCPEYLESTFAALKARLVPVNTNYRYGVEELAYLWDNADASAVIFHGSFTKQVIAVHERLSTIKQWIFVDDGYGSCPPFAIRYEEAVSTPGAPVRYEQGRSGDDIFLLYTGGTTGLPKGVMWRQDDLFSLLNGMGIIRIPEEEGLEGVARTITSPGARLIVACPLMHGTGIFAAINTLSTGGTVITLTSHSFDAEELLDAVVREKANLIALVGDAFAKPILSALDANPSKWDLSSLLGIISSGVMWSEQTKEGLLAHHPNMVLVDTFSSSEALGMGQSLSAATSTNSTAQFVLGENAKVIDEEGNEIEPGSGRVGLLAVAGRNPLGYYKDASKTNATFRYINGTRYCIPGDYALVDKDRTIRLLGRGSVCINTGGEKVYPEEVEEVIKLHPDISDAAVVGVPDDRFGEVVCAVVEAIPGSKLSEGEVISWVKDRLASYKAPKHVCFVPSMRRAPNGKIDYPATKQVAVKAICSEQR